MNLLQLPSADDPAFDLYFLYPETCSLAQALTTANQIICEVNQEDDETGGEGCLDGNSVEENIINRLERLGWESIPAPPSSIVWDRNHEKSAIPSYVDFDTFLEKYQPEQNRFDTNASWDGCMYETFGDEIEYVKNMPANRVWTILDGATSRLVSGFHLVNRLGYLVCAEPFELDANIEVLDEY